MKKFGNNAKWAMFDNFSQQVFSFIVFFILARILDPSDFGHVAIGLMVVFFFRMVFLELTSLPLLRSPIPTDEIYNWTFSYSLLIGGISFVIVYVTSPIIAQYYDSLELVPILRILGVCLIFFGAARAYELKLQREAMYKTLAIRSLVSVLLSGTVSIVLALNDFGVMALVFQQLMLPFFALVVLIFNANWRPKFVLYCSSVFDFKSDFKYFTLSSLFGYLVNNIDTFVVSSFFGSYWLGLYNFAKRLVSSIYLVVGSSLIKIAASAFASADNDLAMLKKSYVITLGTTLLVMLPFISLLATFSTPIVELIFGYKWEQAIPFIVALSFLYLFFAVNDINDTLLISRGMSRSTTNRRFVQLIISIVLSCLLWRNGVLLVVYLFSVASLIVLAIYQKKINILINFEFSEFFFLCFPIAAMALVPVVILYFYKMWFLSFNFVSILFLILCSMFFMCLFYFILLRTCSRFVNVYSYFRAE